MKIDKGKLKNMNSDETKEIRIILNKMFLILEEAKETEECGNGNELSSLVVENLPMIKKSYENFIEKYAFLTLWKDDIIEKLIKYDASTIEELYQKGKTKGTLDFIKDYKKWLESDTDCHMMICERTCIDFFLKECNNGKIC